MEFSWKILLLAFPAFFSRSSPALPEGSNQGIFIQLVSEKRSVPGASSPLRTILSSAGGQGPRIK